MFEMFMLPQLFQLDVCSADYHLRGVTYAEYQLIFHRAYIGKCEIENQDIPLNV